MAREAIAELYDLLCELFNYGAVNQNRFMGDGFTSIS
jgi:hypothetical protein